uniref:sulfite oxidase n=1 Tax=Helicotheca tamesis TaxID=374047 RepID=A0A7S2MXZ7_9STRA
MIPNRAMFRQTSVVARAGCTKLPRENIKKASFASLRGARSSPSSVHTILLQKRWQGQKCAVSQPSLCRSFSAFSPSGGSADASSSQSSFAGAFGVAFLAGFAGCAILSGDRKNVTDSEAAAFASFPPLSSAPSIAPSIVKNNDEVDEETDNFPVYTVADVAKNNGKDGSRIWMSYGGMVYDVTDFVPNHPGGSEKIMMAAGSAIEPYWYLYRQHFASDLPMNLMEKLVIGRLNEADQDKIDEVMEKMSEESDPYALEPTRHPALIVHSEQPMNAEVPEKIITENYITPPEYFYIRHHHPVPFLSEKEIKNYHVKFDLTEYGGKEVEISLADLKKLKKVEITTTLQCSGNRRSGFNEVKKTSGTSWGQGALSTAKWGGARLKDVLELAGLKDAIAAEDEGLEHVRFESLDGMKSSIRIDKAMNPYGDCILAYEMNGEPLPRDHGFPVRVIVPGYSAVRNVKWVSKVQLSKAEAEGPWQRGLNYKTLPPSVTDAKSIDIDSMPSMMIGSVFSGITSAEVSKKGRALYNAGDNVMVKASGWAWAGGGRNIVRVDLTGDKGKTWATADIKQGNDQKYGRAWAWVFWSCELPATVGENGTVEIHSKALDIAFNVQPENCSHTWNVRGLGNNSWYRKIIAVN